MSRYLALVVLGAVSAAGCGGSELKSRASATNDVIAKARDNGAQRCAPRELALAESHHDFALQDLDEGNFHRARTELVVAEKNANEALAKSPKARCNPDKVAVVVKTPTDRDGDGILDKLDKCPDVPEDPDGFEDDDGCPDTDNDADGLPECPDPIDKCPDKPEDKDGVEDDDGCPDYTLVTVTDKKIELKQTVYFDTAKTTIKSRSFALLNEVARVLVDNAKIKVRIEGHTDSRGSDRYNLKLSDGRAASVRRYLIDKGIDAGRMTSKGFGERVPIADNRTRQGRGQNRRVEFFITSR